MTSCGPTIEPDSAVAAGSWGGVGIRVDVTGLGAIIEYDCAHGTIDQPLVADRNGRWLATGTHVREHGGPIRLDEPPDRHPAQYEGQLAGSSMRLIVTVPDLQQVLSFNVTLSATARLAKCL